MTAVSVQQQKACGLLLLPSLRAYNTKPDTVTVGDHLRAGLWQWTWRDQRSGLGQLKQTSVSFRISQCCENWEAVMPQAHLPTV
eukprot:1051585-Rhodomonas_salina.1